MTWKDKLAQYESTEARDLVRLFEALRAPPEEQAPPHFRARVLAQGAQRQPRWGWLAWLPPLGTPAGAPALAAPALLQRGLGWMREAWHAPLGGSRKLAGAMALCLLVLSAGHYVWRSTERAQPEAPRTAQVEPEALPRPARPADRRMGEGVPAKLRTAPAQELHDAFRRRTLPPQEQSPAPAALLPTPPAEVCGAWHQAPITCAVGFVRAYYEDLARRDVEAAVAKWVAIDAPRLRQMIERSAGYTLRNVWPIQEDTAAALVGVDVTVHGPGQVASRWCGPVEVVRVAGAWKIKATRGGQRLTEPEPCPPQRGEPSPAPREGRLP